MHDTIRAARLKLAFATSLASRALGFLAQFLALPLIIAGLGVPRYAAFVAITALVAWVGPLGFGLLPALTRELADARAAGNAEKEARLIGAAVWFTLAMALVLGVFTVAVGYFGDIAALIGAAPDLGRTELRFGFVAAMGITSVHFLASTSSAIRAGYQESHVSNGLSLAANLLIIIGLVGFTRETGSISLYVLLLYAPLTLLMLFDLGRLLATHPGLWPPAFPHRATRQSGDLNALTRTSGTAWAGQIHYFLTIFGSVLLVSHLYDAADTAAFGSLMRAIVLFSGVVGIFIWPLVPALTDAAGRRNVGWVWICYRNLIVATLSSAGLVALVLVVAGPALMNVWLGPDVAPSRLLCTLFGAYLLVSSLNFAGFNVLLALNATRSLALTFLAEIVLASGLAVLIRPVMGVEGVALALLLAALAINAWYLPLQTWRRLTALDAKALASGSPAPC